MRARRPVFLALALGMTLAACGGGGGDGDSGDGPAAAPSEESQAGGVPDTTVLDLASNEKVSVASTVAADKPTLYWFWAPY